jgi:H+/Cl- antiporter ClcA
LSWKNEQGQKWPRNKSMISETGKWIMLTGVILVLAGIIIYFFHDKVHWLGRLPGDIRVERENFRFYFPITTMILFSIVFSLLVHLFRKLF